MAIGELLEALEREAAAEVAALVAAAHADAERATAAAAARRERRRAGELSRIRAAARETHDAAIAEAARRSRGAVLAARAAALDRVRAAVAAQLPALLERGGDRVLERLIAAILAVAGDGGRLRCTPAITGAVTARVAGRAGMTVESDPGVVAGVVADRAGGRVVVDATLGTLLDRLWPRLRVEVRVGEAAAP